MNWQLKMINELYYPLKEIILATKTNPQKRENE